MSLKKIMLDEDFGTLSKKVSALENDNSMLQKGNEDLSFKIDVKLG